MVSSTYLSMNRSECGMKTLTMYPFVYSFIKDVLNILLSSKSRIQLKAILRVTHTVEEIDIPRSTVLQQ